MRILDSKELKEKINSGEKFIVDMYADWCGPCRMMGKVIETVSDKLAKENHGVKLYKFNIETDKEMATSLNVRSIPMLIGFNDGKSVSVKVGVVPETQIIEMANNI